MQSCVENLGERSAAIHLRAIPFLDVPGGRGHEWCGQDAACAPHQRQRRRRNTGADPLGERDTWEERQHVCDVPHVAMVCDAACVIKRKLGGDGENDMQRAPDHERCAGNGERGRAGLKAVG
jgi:hypothetical protein